MFGIEVAGPEPLPIFANKSQIVLRGVRRLGESRDQRVQHDWQAVGELPFASCWDDLTAILYCANVAGSHGKTFDLGL